MNSEISSRKILVLGASGLLGRFITDDLRLRGFQAIGVARHFEPSQKTGASDLELPIMSMEIALLARMMFSAVHGIISLGLEERLVAVPPDSLRVLVRQFVETHLIGIGVVVRA